MIVNLSLKFQVVTSMGGEIFYLGEMFYPPSADVSTYCAAYPIVFSCFRF